MNQVANGFEHLDAERLSGFIDGELGEAEASGVRLHLAECHACSLRALAATQIKAATARGAERFSAPPDAMARLTAQLRPQAAKKAARVYSFRTIALLAVAAALVLTVSLAGWQQTRQRDTLTAELLDQHLATMSSGAAPQVVSEDRHTVKPWFQGKLPFSFNLPESLPANTALKGGDMAYVDGKPAALLLFMIKQHEVSVFVTQRGSGAAELSSVRSGFAIHTATTSELRLTAVSNVSAGELDDLLGALVAVQSPR